jgi:hypothetical protein
MSVQVDETRDQCMVGQRDVVSRAVIDAGLRHRQNGDDAAARDDDGVVREHAASRCDRKHPACLDYGVNGLRLRIHACSIQKKALPEQGFYQGRLA